MYGNNVCVCAVYVLVCMCCVCMYGNNVRLMFSMALTLHSDRVLRDRKTMHC